MANKSKKRAPKKRAASKKRKTRIKFAAEHTGLIQAAKFLMPPAAGTAGPFEFGTRDLGDNPFTPAEIKYYKLGLSTENGLSFQFLDGSGIAADLQARRDITDIDAFVQMVVAGNPTVRPFDVPDSAPDIRVSKPCYVVMELDSNLKVRYLAGVPAIMTAVDCTDYYFNLAHVTTAGNSSTPDAPATEYTCRILHFGVVEPRQATGDTNADYDRFNLYLEFDQGYGEMLPIILDPDIKNDGGPP